MTFSPYGKGDPACSSCKGRGVRVELAPDERKSVRCECTDRPKPRQERPLPLSS